MYSNIIIIAIIFGCIVLYIFNRIPIFIISKKIKCVNRDGNKVYFVPTSKLYDKIEVDKTKGDEYTYTETDALTLGYVRYKKITNK